MAQQTDGGQVLQGGRSCCEHLLLLRRRASSEAAVAVPLVCCISCYSPLSGALLYCSELSRHLPRLRIVDPADPGPAAPHVLSGSWRPWSPAFQRLSIQYAIWKSLCAAPARAALRLSQSPIAAAHTDSAVKPLLFPRLHAHHLYLPITRDTVQSRLVSFALISASTTSALHAHSRSPVPTTRPHYHTTNTTTLV
jgi:hypothetical protein